MKFDINCETGEITTSEYTAKEIAEFKASQKELEAAAAAAQAEADAKAAAKASAMAKLKALGLSDEESAAILG
jgi:hypothetical protein